MPHVFSKNIENNQRHVVITISAISDEEDISEIIDLTEPILDAWAFSYQQVHTSARKAEWTALFNNSNNLQHAIQDIKNAVNANN